jgi:ABC-type glycerol-3-phosphate transport system permease component
MFLQSIVGGLSTLLHWQVWVALIIYVLLKFGWLLLVGAIMGGRESAVRQGAGCITHTIGGSIYYGLLLGLLILLLLPIMMGGDSFFPLALVKVLAWPIFKACMIATVAIIVLTFVPIVGGLVNSLPGLDDFIQGIIIFRIFSVAFIESQLNLAGLPKSIYPGFWESAGFLIIAVALISACMVGGTAVGHKFKKNRYDDEDNGIGFLLVSAVMPLAGLLPLFMYAKHVYISIQQLVK